MQDISTFLKDSSGKWLWPLAAVGLLTLTHAAKKSYIFAIGIYGIAVSQDKKFVLKDDPGEIREEESISQTTKTLILIRHGESAWNEVWNGKFLALDFPFRLIYSIARELILFVTEDSGYFDSPLSMEGIVQARRLAMFLNRDKVDDDIREFVEILRSADDKSVVISSPLRRCVETATLALHNRLSTSPEKIIVTSTLQEMTRNVDGISLAMPNKPPPVSYSLRALETGYGCDWETFFEERLDCSGLAGMKPKQLRGDERLDAFLKFLFEQCPAPTAILSGHSLYFKKMFEGLLPRNSKHTGKSTKIRNGGVVACSVTRFEFPNGECRYRMDEGSIVPIFGGFKEKKRK